MTVATANPQRARTGKRRAATRPAPQQSLKLEKAAPPRPQLKLDTITNYWQRALDAADSALRAAEGSVPPAELQQRRYALVRERQRTGDLLRSVAATAGIRRAPWLSPVPVGNRMLGLPATVRACLFDVEGVLTDGAALHAWAWAEVFDDFLLRLAGETGWPFIPFDRVADYRAHLDGRPRLEGIHAFLGSRGIRLPEGRADDPAGADTAYGLARRKGDALERGLHRRGVAALPGAARYLEAAGRAGLGRAVLSASSTTLPMLEAADLATLVEICVDAELVRTEGLRARPAPDLLLAGCRELGVPPAEAVTLTHSAAGVVAGHAAGLGVIVVADGPDADLLRGFGERVVPTLSALLDSRLSANP